MQLNSQQEDIMDCRNNCVELESSELDLVILGIVQSAINCDEVSSSGRKETKQQWARVNLSFHGDRICLKTFLFMHRLHKSRFYSLVKHYRKNGLTLRTHRNTKQLPSSAFSVETGTRCKVYNERGRRPSPFTSRPCPWLQTD